MFVLPNPVSTQYSLEDHFVGDHLTAIIISFLDFPLVSQADRLSDEVLHRRH